MKKKDVFKTLGAYLWSIYKIMVANTQTLSLSLLSVEDNAKRA